MATDPWSRPSMEDLKAVLESIERKSGVDQREVDSNQRSVERLRLSLPAEVMTGRGNTIPAVTREISRFGLGLLHRGAIQPGEVTVKMASESRQFEYRVNLKWCTPCDNGMFISGGEFIGRA